MKHRLMRAYMLVCLAFVSSFMFAQIIQSPPLEIAEEHDNVLIGIWNGSFKETDAITIQWQRDRKADGSQVIFYQIVERQDTFYAQDKGRWYTANGKIHQVTDRMGVLHPVAYKLNNKGEVRFTQNPDVLEESFLPNSYVEIRGTDRSQFYLDKIEAFEIKTLQQTMKAYDQLNGFHHSPSEGVQDPRFVGVWKGAERDSQIKGITKMWKMTRNNDGTFVLDFTILTNGKTTKHTEKGLWWIKEDKFYEFHEDSEMTDIYTFEFLSDKKIKFKVFEMAIDPNNKTYEFIDTKSR